MSAVSFVALGASLIVIHYEHETGHVLVLQTLQKYGNVFQEINLWIFPWLVKSYKEEALSLKLANPGHDNRLASHRSQWATL